VERVAVLQLDAKGAERLARLEVIVVVGRVVEAAVEVVLADRGVAGRPRAEASRREVAPEVGSRQEADLGVEVLRDDDPIQLNAVAIGRVVELPAIADVLPFLGLRSRLRRS
jgi:hypothetical protein